MQSRCLARQKEFESPTFRLGGGRSILLSYWRIYWNIVSENKTDVNCRDSTEFETLRCYTEALVWKGGTAVKEGSDPYVDLDDLIYDEEDGGPSER